MLNKQKVIDDFLGCFSLISVNEQVDTRTVSGGLVLNVLMSVAQGEWETIVERAKEALSHQKGQRRAYYRSVYGFRVLNGDLVEDAEQQAVVAGIQRMRGQGMSLRAIATFLNEQGIPRQRGGLKWYASTIKSILENEIHEGLL